MLWPLNLIGYHGNQTATFAANLETPAYLIVSVPDARTFLLNASSGELRPKLIVENGWWAGAGKKQKSPVLHTATTKILNT